MPDSTDDALLRLRRARPFAARIDAARAEPVGVAFAHSGTAFFAPGHDGRRYKLRDCGRARRAAATWRWIRLLPDVFPEPIAREGRYLLLEALEDYRRVTRAELVRRADRLGRVSATAHRVGCPAGPADRLRRAALSRLAAARFRADLRFVRRRGLVPEASCAGALRKWRAHYRRFGLPVALELDDFHKGNVMVRDADGDLRYVDEEGIGLRPKGAGMASFLKTVTTTETWECFREGYGRVADAGFLTPEYTEYLLLMDAVRRVARKARTAARTEKLPREIAQLRAMADTPDLALGWRFPAG